MHIVMAQSGTAMGAVVAGASAMVAPETALVNSVETCARANYARHCVLETIVGLTVEALCAPKDA